MLMIFILAGITNRDIVACMSELSFLVSRHGYREDKHYQDQQDLNGQE